MPPITNEACVQLIRKKDHAAGVVDVSTVDFQKTPNTHNTDYNIVLSVLINRNV